MDSSHGQDTTRAAFPRNVKLDETRIEDDTTFHQNGRVSSAVRSFAAAKWAQLRRALLHRRDADMNASSTALHAQAPLWALRP